ncbi:flagellar protein FlgN [Sphingomonas japonica]|uniref:Ser/Thr protein kinase RdoA (MazF antagonist) n=1 Tax=Sphingomonas japonica TaxID=511662 RepID=A0ABX0U5C7_9SPHN|nr:flagellar protein FlgN [Sphingomonas japonica]NIJ23987.1 Ser/Thr protein kinase RdoA (MazF antagonist) [Sphingomonas japonica]
MNRRDALIAVIESLHAEIAALKANDVPALEAATEAKLVHIEAVAANDDEPISPEITALADEAHKLNETARIYVNLMAANVRRRLQTIAGAGAAPYAPGAMRYA